MMQVYNVISNYTITYHIHIVGLRRIVWSFARIRYIQILLYLSKALLPSMLKLVLLVVSEALFDFW